mmetsp:Transcript_85409/g.170973  ORF Transcript_85409/g.170973 Transcript_85409/m.170973 type:complete len:262 (+) Transcript_85409:493-1278(+)
MSAKGTPLKRSMKNHDLQYCSATRDLSYSTASKCSPLPSFKTTTIPVQKLSPMSTMNRRSSMNSTQYTNPYNSASWLNPMRNGIMTVRYSSSGIMTAKSQVTRNVPRGSMESAFTSGCRIFWDEVGLSSSSGLAMVVRCSLYFSKNSCMLTSPSSFFSKESYIAWASPEPKPSIFAPEMISAKSSAPEPSLSTSLNLLMALKSSLSSSSSESSSTSSSSRTKSTSFEATFEIRRFSVFVGVSFAGSLGSSPTLSSSWGAVL